MYDAIIVGARCAGSPLAMLLARKGYRVLLLDKAGTVSLTEFFSPENVERIIERSALKTAA